MHEHYVYSGFFLRAHFSRIKPFMLKLCFLVLAFIPDECSIRRHGLFAITSLSLKLVYAMNTNHHALFPFIAQKQFLETHNFCPLSYQNNPRAQHAIQTNFVIFCNERVLMWTEAWLILRKASFLITSCLAGNSWTQDDSEGRLITRNDSTRFLWWPKKKGA